MIIYLEFKHEHGNLAANGTDTVFFVDGRWSAFTRRIKIEEKVRALREGVFASRYQKQLFVGYTTKGAVYGAVHSMRDPNPPQWAYDKDDRNVFGPYINEYRKMSMDEAFDREEMTP